jgi:hypothetical protein
VTDFAGGFWKQNAGDATGQPEGGLFVIVKKIDPGSRSVRDPSIVSAASAEGPVAEKRMDCGAILQECCASGLSLCTTFRNQALKGIWWMPWH